MLALVSKRPLTAEIGNCMTMAAGLLTPPSTLSAGFNHRQCKAFRVAKASAYRISTVLYGACTVRVRYIPGIVTALYGAMETLVPGQSAPFTQHSIVYVNVYDRKHSKSLPMQLSPPVTTSLRASSPAL